MKRCLRPGQGTMAGLRWLANVGPATFDAWGAAMGWGQTATYSHASRLVEARWAKRTAMAHGAGSLIHATRAGVDVGDVPAAAVARTPSPTSWAHCEACAWVAAWLTARGREMVGPRSLLADDVWRGELEWMERGGVRRRGHRPDLLGGIAGGALLPIEVELASKSLPGLKAILALHAIWIGTGRTSAVIYVCGSETVASRIREQGAEIGLTSERKNLRVELLATIREGALAARRRPVSAEAGTDEAADHREVA